MSASGPPRVGRGGGGAPPKSSTCAWTCRGPPRVAIGSGVWLDSGLGAAQRGAAGVARRGTMPTAGDAEPRQPPAPVEGIICCCCPVLLAHRLPASTTLPLLPSVPHLHRAFFIPRRLGRSRALRRRCSSSSWRTWIPRSNRPVRLLAGERCCFPPTLWLRRGTNVGSVARGQAGDLRHRWRGRGARGPPHRSSTPPGARSTSSILVPPPH